MAEGFEVDVGDFMIEFPDTATQEQIQSTVTQFISDNPESFPTQRVPSPESQVVGEAGVAGLPTSALLPPEQTFVEREVGFEPRDPRSEFLETQLGQTGGGIAGGLIGAQRGAQLGAALPGPLRGAATIAGGAIGAFTGGAGGEAIQQAGQLAFDSEFTPKDTRESLTRILQAGGEEALFDAVGNTIFKAIGAPIRALRTRNVKETGQEIISILERGGSRASVDAILDKGIAKSTARLVRGALVGKQPFETLNLANDKAFIKFLNEFTERVGGEGVETLSNHAAGRVLLDTIEGGQRAHSATAGELYSQLDELVPNIPTTRTVTQPQAPLTQALGVPSQATQVPDVIPAVDMTPLKASAQKRLDRLRASGNIGKSVEGGEILEKIVNELPDRVPFGIAHDTRSDLLFRSRSLSAQRAGDPVSATLSDLSSVVTKEMDKAGTALAPEGLAVYKNINKFWKFGKKNMSNKLMKTILGKENAGEILGSALTTVDKAGRVKTIRKAVRVAAKLSGRSFDSIWSKAQGGFLAEMIPQSVEELSTSAFVKLHRNKGLQGNLKQIFPGEQTKEIVNLSRHIDDVLASRQSGGFLNLAQAGAAITAGTELAATGGTENTGSAFAMMIIAPVVFAKIMTRKNGARVLVEWSKSPRGSARWLTAGAKLARMVGLSTQEVADLSGQPPETRIPFRPEQ